MLRRFLFPVTCTAVLALASVLLPVAGPGPAPATWTNKAAARFWTPERMADSMPSSAREIDTVAEPGSIPGPFAPAGAAVHFAGVPTVGVLFSIGDDLNAHFCSASVVHSPGRDLILTAAHCGPGTDIGFVPDYHAGAAKQPYGVWAVTQVFTDPRWVPDDDASSDYDFAFARVAPAPGGKRIEDVTGANRLSRTPGYHNRVTVIGYPHASENPDDQAVSCTTTTSRLEGLRQLQFDCAGFFSGTSGSPWLLNYNSRTRSGTVVGVIGGEDAGGLTDRISYSPFFDDAIQAVYQRAVDEQVKALGPKITAKRR